MNDNDHDNAESQLAAYALGALDPADRQAVEELLATSPAHQEELRQLREVVALLPYAAPPAAPPERVREALFARIEASRAVQAPARPAPAPAAPPRRSAARWLMPALVGALAALVIALGGLTASLGSSVARLNRTNADMLAAMTGLQQSLEATRDRQEAIATQLADSQRQLADSQRQLGQISARLEVGEQQLGQLSARLARDEQVIAFVSAPGVATRQLAPADVAAAARGEMYMYPGESSAVVLFSGLTPLAPGQVYQFWLADGATQVAGGTFEVDESGLARIVVEAPREVNAFSEVMVTVEPSGGSPAPSNQVVLAGSL